MFHIFTGSDSMQFMVYYNHTVGVFNNYSFNTWLRIRNIDLH